MVSKKFRARGIAATVAVLALGLAACSSDGGDSGDKTPDAGGGDKGGNIKVGFSQLGAESGWRTANTESVKASLTAENGIDLTFSDAQQKQENQIKALRDFIDQGVDVIAFSPVVETGWDEVLQEIKDAEIPVVLVDRTVDTTVADPYVTWIGADFKQEGITAGEWVKANHPDAKIFEMQGTLGSGAQVDREAGFDEVVGAENIVGKASGNFTRAEGKAAMEAALQAYPDMNLLFAHNDDMGLGAIEAIEAAGKVPGKDIIIVTVDGVRDGLQALVDKKFNYVVECNPVFGDQILDAIKKVHAGEELPKETIVVDEAFDQTITQADVDARAY
ncbi:MAG: ABC transporter substrate-binding protein [Cellulomonas sp.]|uniref:ABC transporter substrate-binding protein n=1 Tax=Cellulomonas sp. TaxID=40001 RepID=UPI00258FCC33|nr:ABC transporter substrate-binding protein [Cellulomonas sp.]MCR6648425.1 ABC transporter substrate-binding protein [Cellulomonas sp.]MCR6704374.1 ABC transporter substrate-binding protein [Cellulomonas sp.]